MIPSLILAVALSGSPKDVANRSVKHVVAPKAVALTMPALPAVVPAPTNTVTLVWNLSVPGTNQSEAVGYRLYQFTNGVGMTSYDVGNVTNYTAPVDRTITNSFKATAYDSLGNESLFSNEAILPPVMPQTVYREFYFQSSIDMVSWSDVSPQPVKVITNSLGTLPQEFYRMRVQTSTNAP